MPSLATYPPTLDEQPLIVGIHGFATHETYSQDVSLPLRWALTPPSHPYPCGRLFSSTLLYPYEYQAVNLRGALCCSDFPLPPVVSAMKHICVGKGTNISLNLAPTPQKKSGGYPPLLVLASNRLQLNLLDTNRSLLLESVILFRIITRLINLDLITKFILVHITIP